MGVCLGFGFLELRLSIVFNGERELAMVEGYTRLLIHYSYCTKISIEPHMQRVLRVLHDVLISYYAVLCHEPQATDRDRIVMHCCSVVVRDRYIVYVRCCVVDRLNGLEMTSLFTAVIQVGQGSAVHRDRKALRGYGVC